MTKPAENLFIQESLTQNGNSNGADTQIRNRAMSPQSSSSDASVRIRKPGDTKTGRVICSLNNLLVLIFVFVIVLLAAVLFTYFLSKYHFGRVFDSELSQLKNKL